MKCFFAISTFESHVFGNDKFHWTLLPFSNHNAKRKHFISLYNKYFSFFLFVWFRIGFWLSRYKNEKMMLTWFSVEWKITLSRTQMSPHHQTMEKTENFIKARSLSVTWQSTEAQTESERIIFFAAAALWTMLLYMLKCSIHISVVIFCDAYYLNQFFLTDIVAFYQNIKSHNIYLFIECTLQM